jgi:hypothetical protein
MGEHKEGYTTIEEAREAARRVSEAANEPCAVTRKDNELREQEGEYGIRQFIRGQNVKVGGIFTTLGRWHNFHDECLEIIDVAEEGREVSKMQQKEVKMMIGSERKQEVEEIADFIEQLDEVERRELMGFLRGAKFARKVNHQAQTA